MSDCLLHRFRDWEMTERIRTQLLDAIEAAPPSGTTEFRYNIHNVVLDYGERSMTLVDILEPVTLCRMGLDYFQYWLGEAVPGVGGPA